MELLPIKPFQETLHAGMCGPASLKMVLAYWNIEKTESELAALCKTENDLGTTAEALQSAALSLGFKTEIKDNASLEDIGAWLSKKVPVIVDWFSRGRSDYTESEVADGHYSVVAGLDEKNIYLQDPEVGGLRTITREDFMKVWFDFKGSQIAAWDDMIIRQIIAIHR